MSYRHPRYHNNQNFGEQISSVIITFGVALGLPLLVLLIASAANSAPIPRKGQFCPIDYYRTGEYCTPSKSTTPTAVRIIDETCPIGTYTQSDYCINAQ